MIYLNLLICRFDPNLSSYSELMDAMSAMKELDDERTEMDNKAKELQNNVKVQFLVRV